MTGGLGLRTVALFDFRDFICPVLSRLPVSWKILKTGRFWPSLVFEKLRRNWQWTRS